MADRFDIAPESELRRAYGGAAARTHLGSVAAALAASIGAAAPKASGRLAASWRSSVGDDNGQPVAAAHTDVPYWNIPEYGSVDQAPTRYVDKGIRRTGIRYVPSGKNTGGEFA